MVAQRASIDAIVEALGAGRRRIRARSRDGGNLGRSADCPRGCRGAAHPPGSARGDHDPEPAGSGGAAGRAGRRRPRPRSRRRAGGCWRWVSGGADQGRPWRGQRQRRLSRQRSGSLALLAPRARPEIPMAPAVRCPRPSRPALPGASPWRPRCAHAEPLSAPRSPRPTFQRRHRHGPVHHFHRFY